ncbi:hypothetical protein LCGC14_0591380 [marine sediment metagenome]|uniref:Uncharacterized protein n=1 Tax=marine sediment metagenome TaxID=412755 RepID=A0A0F9TZJ1_9ZZZZ
MESILQIAGSLGVGAFLGALIFLMYRKDRLSTERMWRESKKFTDAMVERDQATREANTKALTELNVLLGRLNGNKR